MALRTLSLLLGLALPLSLTAGLACNDDAEPLTTAPGSGGSLSGTITVFAAASLTDAFTAAGESFEAAHPGTKVRFNFAASSALATQLNEGAPADVFASADETQMRAVADKGNVEDARTFAINTPVVVVPSGSDRVSTFSDLAKPNIRLLLAAPEVPIGRYGRQILANASAADGGISSDFATRALATLASNEPNVRSVLAKVQLGEADAGIVYTTDLRAASGEVRAIDIPGRYNVVARYPIAVTRDSARSDVARAFVDYILSMEGQALMHQFGFSAP